MRKRSFMQGICKHHGEVQFKIVSGVKRCPICRSDAVKKRRNKVKQMALDYKGGCCSICGYSKCIKALEFHHLDPNEKEFGIGFKGETRSWARTKIELDKCILVCSNCHREVHAKMHEDLSTIQADKV